VPEQIRASYSYGPDETGRWLRSVLQNSLDFVTIVDDHGTLMFASPAWERALGYDPKEMVGTMNVLDHVHPEDLPRLLKEGEVLALKGDKKTGRLEYRFRHADGSRLWLESVGTYLVDDPAVGGMVVNSRDVTERKQTEEALKEAESRYRTLVEQIPIVTYIDRADDSDTSVYTSPQIEKLLGYSPEEWRVDKLWAKCLHPEDEARGDLQSARDRRGDDLAGPCARAGGRGRRGLVQGYHLARPMPNGEMDRPSRNPDQTRTTSGPAGERCEHTWLHHVPSLLFTFLVWQIGRARALPLCVNLEVELEKGRLVSVGRWE
jgi:PAS domain S-box-containing protein